jgi:hypothetical protein
MELVIAIGDAPFRAVAYRWLARREMELAR